MKYSRQRELIYQTVMHNRVHPSADLVHTLVRSQEPSISLGTVYRNLNLLADQGLLQRIRVPGGSDRFDGELAGHPHILCTGCSQVFDLALADLSSIDCQLKKIPGFTVTGYQLLVEGFCGNCTLQTGHFEKERGS